MSKLRRSTSMPLIRALARLAAIVLALGLAAPLAAQTLSNTFGGLSESSKDPIDIESDVLVVHDSQKYATFKGNVKAVQGTTTLRARELNVHYVGGESLATGGAKKEGGEQAAPATKVADAEVADAKVADAKAGAGAAKAEDGTQISKIEAKGDVIITSEKDQTTTSDWALYDVPGQTVTVGGNVVLTQGKNVLKGDRLVIDLKTGESRFENTGNTAAGGRIRALFMPKQEGADAKAGDAKAGDAKSRDAKSGDAKPDDAAAPADEASGDAKPAAEDQGQAPSDGASKASKPADDDVAPFPIIPGFER